MAKLLFLPFFVLPFLAPLIIGMLWLVQRFGKSVRHRVSLYFGGFVGAIAAPIPFRMWAERHPELIRDGVESLSELLLITLGCFAGILLTLVLYRGHAQKNAEQT